MRQTLVDKARKRDSAKRGGGAIHVSLAEAASVAQDQAANVVALDDALKSLERIDARQGEIVELRFFGGLSIDETAEVLKVSPRHGDARLDLRTRVVVKPALALLPMVRPIAASRFLGW